MEGNSLIQMVPLRNYLCVGVRVRDGNGCTNLFETKHS